MFEGMEWLKIQGNRITEPNERNRENNLRIIKNVYAGVFVCVSCMFLTKWEVNRIRIRSK